MTEPLQNPLLAQHMAQGLAQSEPHGANWTELDEED